MQQAGIDFPIDFTKPKKRGDFLAKNRLF